MAKIDPRSYAALAQAQARLANAAQSQVQKMAQGQVCEVSVRLGQYVISGSQLLFVVPQQQWVIANFKETQTALVHIGQPAHVAVDAGQALAQRLRPGMSMVAHIDTATAP